MTQLGLGLLICVAPSLFWLAWFYIRSQYGRSSAAPLLTMFLGGMVAGPASLFAFHLLGEIPFYRGLGNIYAAAPDVQFAWCMFAIGPIEELAKFLVVWALIFGRAEFSSPVDGLAYAAAAALGFATVENWYYLLETDSVLWTRAVTLPFNHVLFSSFWGVGLSYGKFGRVGRRSQMVVIGLVLSIAYHGVYDYILVAENVPDLLALPLVFVLWLWVSSVHQRMRGTSVLDGMRIGRPRDDDPSHPAK